jgi:hypothetical protein
LAVGLLSFALGGTHGDRRIAAGPRVEMAGTRSMLGWS